MLFHKIAYILPLTVSCTNYCKNSKNGILLQRVLLFKEIPEMQYGDLSTSIDTLGRKIIPLKKESLGYYTGPDAQGHIFHDPEKGDYIEFGGEIRYWRGIIKDIPTNIKRFVGKFLFYSLKPDASKKFLQEEIMETLSNMGYPTLKYKDVCLKQEQIFSIYPYFFSEKFERSLVQFLSSGSTRVCITKNNTNAEDLIVCRDHIRSLYGRRFDSLQNLIHTSDSEYEALRDILLFFRPSELERL